MVGIEEGQKKETPEHEAGPGGSPLRGEMSVHEAEGRKSLGPPGGPDRMHNAQCKQKKRNAFLISFPSLPKHKSKKRSLCRINKLERRGVDFLDNQCTHHPFKEITGWSNKRKSSILKGLPQIVRLFPVRWWHGSRADTALEASGSGDSRNATSGTLL